MKVAVILAVLAFCILGCLNTLLVKLTFATEVPDFDGHYKAFEKPWFVNFLMFAGMCLALCAGRCRRGKQDITSLSVDKQAVNEQPTKVRCGKKFMLLLIPAGFDCLATGLGFLGLVYIPMSTYALLRGAEIPFTALLAVIALRERLYAYHWLAVFLCLSGVILVGLASILGSNQQSVDAQETNLRHVIIGVGLVLASQLLAAAQSVFEEYLLCELDLSETDIVGFEGIWGILLSMLAIFPLLFVLPGHDNGRQEDELEAIQLALHNPSLMCLLFAYMFSCLAYNLAGMSVTKKLSAVHKVMLDALRTMLLWILALFVNYVISESAGIAESWTAYSFLELGGFALLIIGQLIYGAMMRVPGLFYPPGDNDACNCNDSKVKADATGSDHDANEKDGSESSVSTQRYEIV